MGIIRTAFAGGLVAVALGLQAQALDIQELTSSGGIDFWLVEEPSIPIVAVEISFAGGARLDPDDRLGAAKMMAALLEEGAGELDALAFARAAQDLAARFGFSANRDEVTASARMLVSDLDASIKLLASAMAEPRFDEEPVGRVRAQILSGLAEAETDPQEIASRAWFGATFPDHPYGRPEDGTIETVTAISVKDLRDAHSRLLTRSNATVGIVGAIDAARASEVVDRLFAGLTEGGGVTPEPSGAVPPPGVTVVSLDKPQSVAIFGQQGLNRDDPDFIPAYVLNYILGGGGFESRLMTEVREKRGLAYSVYSYLAAMDEAALWLGGVQTANERMGESIDVIRAEWDRIAGGAVSENDLDQARKYLTGAFPLQFDSNAKIAGYLVFLQKEGLGTSYIDERNGLIEAVTLDDLKRVAGRLSSDKLSIVIVGEPAGL